MRYTYINNVEQGERLGRHIFASDGRVLLQEGVQLTVGLISRLRHMGVEALYIKDDRLKDVKIEEVVSETVKRSTIETLKESFHFIQKGKTLDVQKVQKSIKSIIDEVLDSQFTLLSLTDIRTEDNDLFVHSVNVCIISTIIGVKLKLDRLKLQELATGALLHDLGKIVPDEENPELPVYNDHTWKGFNVLRKNKEISTLSAHIALTHHEHVNGSGMPRQLEDDNIHLLSKIVAVANAFDRLVAPVDRAKALFPYEACEHIMALTNTHFSHDVVWHFLRSIAFYPTGSQVKLSTGATGIVVGQHYGLPQRPIIRTFQMTRTGSTDYEVNHVDLANEMTIFIKDMVI
ncbi:HD-GYP domain-containing protein [Halalkalibacter urbisdiaboli]|uniref:HD-GYP domain-containing protein n=1 Tax=Halalkalibacter urbisdiaboli TaxID=1960589 RepID=UPI000B4378F2|nr:HD domain-containing phosphohydrolase [Halalkalibacter urbisdiaboli]